MTSKQPKIAKFFCLVCYELKPVEKIKSSGEKPLHFDEATVRSESLELGFQKTNSPKMTSVYLVLQKSLHPRAVSEKN